MKLKKFPVTASNGTKFLISFTERRYFIGRSLEIRLYLPRKRFGFQWVYVRELFDYDRDNPDYIAISKAAVDDYYDRIAQQAESRRKKAEGKARRQAAQNAFTAWDGKITKEVSAK